MTPENCPECGRPRVRNWVYDHRRANPACSIGNREDATQAADYEHPRLVFVRPSTATELTLAGITEPTGREETLVRKLSNGIHHREIAGVDAP